jgi:predicted transcriptional regulator
MSTTASDDDLPEVHPLDQRERTVLYLLLHEPVPWSVDEIGVTLGDRTDAADAVGGLASAGLVHRLGDFVFPTHAARRSDELHEGAL